MRLLQNMFNNLNIQEILLKNNFLKILQIIILIFFSIFYNYFMNIYTYVLLILKIF